MTRREEDAIVLIVNEGKDADRIVSMLVETGELVRALAPAAARSRRRFAGTLLPAALVRARWTVRREGSMPVLSEMQLKEAPPEPEPLDRFYVVSHLLEVVAAFAREGAEDARMFRLLRAVMARLTAGDAALPLARYGESWILRLAGLLPDLAACESCGLGLAGRDVALAPERGACCEDHAPPGALRVPATAVAWIAATRDARPDQLPPLSRRDDEQIARLLHGMVVSFTEKPLKSWSALIAFRHGSSGRNEVSR